MAKAFYFGVLIAAVIWCQACQRQPPLRGPFVRAAYSDVTTEIVDHTLFELVGTAPFYESYFVYQRRMNEYEPDDSTGRRAFWRRYVRNRQTYLRPVILVAWPRLSSSTLALEKRNRFLAAVSRTPTKKPASSLDDILTADGLYQRLLLTMHCGRLRVEEMKNTGLYTLITPTRSVYPKSGFYWPSHEWQSSKVDRLPVEQFAVSQAVVNRAGTRGCLLFERLGSGYGRAEFVFVERREGRWVLVHRFDFWTS